MTLRIGLFTTEFPSPSQTFVLNQITGLLDAGHQVDIFALEQGVMHETHEDVSAYRLLDRVIFCKAAYQRIKGKIIHRIILGSYYILKYIFRYPRCIFNSINIFKYGKKAASFNCLFKVLPFIETKPYDVIHCHFGPCGKYALAMRKLGAIEGKIVTTFHGYDLSTYLNRHGDDIYEELFREGDLFLPISRFWKQKLICLGCDEKKIVVHPMGIDVSRFTFQPIRDKEKNKKFILLTIARLVEKKGVEYGIEAVNLLRREFPSLEYWIVGDGPLKEKIVHLMERLDLHQKVKLYGWKNQDEIASLMSQADMLIAPSVTTSDGDQEGIPVVLMEALAIGLTVVSTHHSGIPELIKDGENGMLVKERDQVELSQKIAFGIRHRETLDKMRENGRFFIENHHDIKLLNQKLFSLLLNISGKR